MAAQAGGKIDTVMHEKRVFPPPRDFAAKARIKSLDAYERLYVDVLKEPAPRRHGDTEAV